MIYCSGPMTGYKKANNPAFDRAAKRLRKKGFKVLSPPEEDLKKFKKIPENPTPEFWQKVLRRDLKDMLRCDSIHLLKGWEKSKGATLEYMLAKELGMKVVDRNGKAITPPRSSSESILVEAERLTNGPRRRTYGHPIDNFSRTATIWSGILGNTISAEQVGLCMVAVKLAREVNGHTRDNLVDIAGYANTLDMISTKRSEVLAIRDRADG